MRERERIKLRKRESHRHRVEREREGVGGGGGGWGELGTETVNKHSDTQSRRGSRALRSNYGCLIRGKHSDREQRLRDRRTAADCRWMCECVTGLRWIFAGPGVNGITPRVPRLPSVLLLEETCGCRASRSPRLSSRCWCCCSGSAAAQVSQVTST